MMIDVHTHILPKKWPDLSEKYGYGEFVSLEHVDDSKANMMRCGQCFRQVKNNCYDLNQRLDECDAHGVSMQVLSTVPVMFNYWAKPEHTLELAKLLNDHLAECIALHPNRFLGLATLPMQDSTLAVEELERVMTSLNLSGIQIGSHINGMNLNHESLLPIYEACEALGAAIFVHPWDMMGKESMTEYWLPWLVGMPAETSRAICSLIFGGILEKFPKLKFGFAHGGGAFIGTIGRICHGFSVRPDLCAVDNPHMPTKYLDRLFFDSLVHEMDALELLIKKVGVHKIMLGTDYPFPLGETIPGSLLKEANLSDAELAACLSGTARSFLSLEGTL